MHLPNKLGCMYKDQTFRTCAEIDVDSYFNHDEIKLSICHFGYHAKKESVKQYKVCCGKLLTDQKNLLNTMGCALGNYWQIKIIDMKKAKSVQNDEITCLCFNPNSHLAGFNNTKIAFCEEAQGIRGKNKWYLAFVYATQIVQ